MQRLGFLTVVLLAGLRLTIGWHFFTTGMSHYSDPKWSSEGFLRQAKGPLAPRFKAVLPDPNDWAAILHESPPPKDDDKSRAVAPAEETAQAATPPKENEKKTAKNVGDDKPDAKKNSGPKPGETPETQIDAQYRNWVAAARQAWESEQQLFSDVYQLDDKQKASTGDALSQRLEQWRQYLADNKEAVKAYWHANERYQELAESLDAGDVPYQQQRLSKSQNERDAKLNAFVAEVRSIGEEFRGDLHAVLNKEQRAHDSWLNSKLPLVDRWVKLLIVAVGVGLILGLFTRLASLGGALFLASVLAMQPPWIVGTEGLVPYVAVEFVALLTLATTAVGRWGGLDFFIHYLIVQPLFGGRGD